MGEDDFFFNIESLTDESLYARFRDCIAAALKGDQLKPGDRLPSMRDFARRLNLSQSAVRKVFDQLIAEGWLEVRHGSGSFIGASAPILARQSIEPASEIASGVGVGGEHELGSEALSQEQSFGWHPISQNHWCGQVELQAMQALGDAVHSGALNAQRCRFGYEPIPEPCSGHRFEQAVELWTSDCRNQPASLTDPAGLPELREYIANWLNQSRGMKSSPNNIFVMNNLSECRSFIARLLIDKHTAVMLEDPGMNRFWLQAYTDVLRPVSLDDSGIITEELDHISDAQLAYISPSCQIPTGAVLSRTRREKLLQWAQANRTTLVEEDSNCEFSFDSRIIPSIHSMDDSASTFYIGAPLSIFPEQMHFAFMVVPDAVRAPFTRLKSLANRCTSPILQRLVLRMFEKEYVQERVRKLQRLLEERRTVLLEELSKIPAGTITYSLAKSGTFQCLWLGSEIDDTQLAEQCSPAALFPSSPYYLQPVGRPAVSISFAQPDSGLFIAQKLKDALLCRNQ